MLLNVTLILFHVSLLLFFFPLMLLYISEENIFFFINHCGVTTCGQTDQEPVKLSKVSKVSKYADVEDYHTFSGIFNEPVNAGMDNAGKLRSGIYDVYFCLP